ncbi:MAG: hypothetical protein ACK55E_08515, partial [Cyanobacteriota bacterium]
VELRHSWAIGIRSPAHACCNQASILYAYCVELAIVDLNLPRSGLVQQRHAADAHPSVPHILNGSCAPLMPGVGKMQTAVSPSHRPEHVRRDSEAICSPMAGTDAMLNIQ